MGKKLENILTICMDCKKIGIDKETNLWLAEEQNSKLYQEFIEIYKENLSHGHCPECNSNYRKKYGLKPNCQS